MSTISNLASALLDKVVHRSRFWLTSGLLMMVFSFHMFSLSAQTPRKDSGADGALVISGTIVSAADGKPIEGVSVQAEGQKERTSSKSDGSFRLAVSKAQSTVSFSHVGFRRLELQYTTGVSMTVKLIPLENQLEEVEVVSTGYQKIPKERATGSFVQLDNAILNRTVSTNILDRLDGMVSGLVTNTNSGSRSPITIRGNSTIYGNQMPLIVMDNFPYEGSLESINPNDIENITVLKDAAAASIWGVRAGNGVIVINTKKGKNHQPQVNLLSSVTFTQKPDLFARSQISSTDYIALETSLFDKGYFWNLADGFSAISPIVAMLQQRKQGLIVAADSAELVNRLGTYDARTDISRYVYRSAVNQQHAFSVRGGGHMHTYFISAGLDDNKGNIYGKSDSRYSLTAKNNFGMWNDRLTISSDIYLSDVNNKQNTNPYTSGRYPYERMYDEDGRVLPTVKDLRMDYLAHLDASEMLDWYYYPAKELEPNQSIKSTDYRLNHRLDLKIFPGIQFSADYLFQKGVQTNKRYYSEDAYFTRNLINSFTQYDQTTGQYNRPIPVGAIFDLDNSQYSNRAGRIQLNVDKSFGKHDVHALGGYEIRDYQSLFSSDRRYGYDSATGISGNNAMDFSKDYSQYYGYGSSRITARVENGGKVDRNRSVYFNGSYSYDKRYTISFSARRDESNLFGVKSNQKAVPLWSAGGLWKISDEQFYRSDILPILRLRSSYGYNGNLDKSVTAYLTTQAGTGVNSFGNGYLRISNPPNPSLRWERVGIWNIGLDFESKTRRLTGSIEYYRKSSTDLIANSPLVPQSGVLSIKGNAADMSTQGWDVTLNSRNIIGVFGWETMALISGAKDKITNYKAKQSNNLNVVTGNYINPLEGYPLFALFSFPYLGLDGSGNPKGLLNGIESQDYSGIMTNANSDDLIYSGVASPTFFGSLMNTFHYHGFDLSFNISFKAGHKYRRPSVAYSELLNNYAQPDYNNRWQKSGDENWTSVPSMVYPFNSNRESLYKYGTVLVTDASAIRLKDFRLGYRKSIPALKMRDIQFFFYANNFAILWKANAYGQDPDSPLMPVPRTYSIGVNANF